MKQMRNTNKRAQVDKEKTLALVAIAVASIMLVAGILFSKALWGQANYLSKVADKKEKARDQLIENKESIDTLRASYEEFNSKNPNLLGGAKSGEGPNDGENSKLVLDALPSSYDFPATVTSVEALISDFEIIDISGIDDSIAQEDAATNSGYVEIPVMMEFNSTYSEYREVISRLKRSIRPFKIVKMELDGDDADLTSSIEVITYYQPEAGFKIERKQVR